MSTIADYNNNPGNIKPPKGVTYDGQIGVDDRGFAIFENKDYGRKALVGDIEIKLKNGLTSPEAFINRYAPAGSENDEDARMNYKIFLADQLGMKSTADNFPENSAQKIADAIAHFESGTRPDQTTKTETPAVPAPPTEGNIVASAPKPLELPPIIGAAAGAFGGLGVGTTAAMYQAKLDAAKKGIDLFNEKINPFTTSAEVPPAQTVTQAVDSVEPVKPVAKSDTPGGKWGAKTGYGVGEGTVQESSSRYQRSLPKGKVSGPMAKLWGIQLPGESPDLAQRLIDRAKASEAKQTTDKVRSMHEAQKAIDAENARLSKSAEASMLAREAQEAAQASKASPLAQYAKKLFSLPVRGAITGAGLGFGAVDALNRYNAGDKLGASLSTGATALGTAVPMLAPLSAATVGLYDSPEARKRFLDAMQADGAMSERAGRRFGLD